MKLTFVYALTITLLIGNIVQFMDLKTFTDTDIHEQRHSMPYTFSESDMFIRQRYEDAAQTMLDLVSSGKKIILVYNYRAYVENLTNPEKLPERLCLTLGLDKFQDSIFMFTGKPDAFKKRSRRPILRVPMLAISELPSFLDNINDESNYYVFECQEKKKRFLVEREIIMNEIRNKFILNEIEEAKPFNIYKLTKL